MPVATSILSVGTVVTFYTALVCGDNMFFISVIHRKNSFH